MIDKKKRIAFSVSLLFFILANFPGFIFAQDAVQKAVMIIAHNNFRDEELLVPKGILETNGIKVVLASSALSPAQGMLGELINPDILIEDVQVNSYQAVIFIGGSGAREFWDNPRAHKIALQAQEKGKIIGAICITPVTLAKAGLLKGRKATVWPGAAQELEINGAEYTGDDLEVDGNIITADGPQAAEKFAQALVRALKQKGKGE
jgi:protease I